MFQSQEARLTSQKEWTRSRQRLGHCRSLLSRLTCVFDSLPSTHTCIYTHVHAHMHHTHTTHARTTHTHTPHTYITHAHKHTHTTHTHKHKDVGIDDWSMCNRCETVRPPRAHHCKRCRRCVRMMDHHCPWCVAPAGWIAAILASCAICSLSCITMQDE